MLPSFYSPLALYRRLLCAIVAGGILSSGVAWGQSPFDLSQQPDEHPLTPLIRALNTSLTEVDQNVRDYSCTLVKRERIKGELGEMQHIFLKVRHEPFSVYMQFLQPHQGREVLYVDGQNGNELLALEAGWKRRVLGRLKLDPEGMVAMNGQKYPITRVGMRNLLLQLIEVFESEKQFAECEVNIHPETKINGRTTTMFQVTHPIPRQNFRAHVTRVFFDNELRVPIHYDAHMWPQREGEEPPLDESYTYTNLQLNNGLTDRDFHPDNGEIFKP